MMFKRYYLIIVPFLVLNKFLFKADMLAQHRLLKSVKGEKKVNVCQILVVLYCSLSCIDKSIVNLLEGFTTG